MNLLWIVALSAFVLIEKNFTASRTLPVVSGIVFLAWGASVLYGAMR